MTRPRSLPACALLVVLAAGCGMSAQSGPQVLDLPVGSASLPLDRPVDPAPDQAEVSATAYFATDSDELVPVVRRVPSVGGPGAQLAAVVSSLVEGPTDAEAEAGLRSAVPPTTSILAATIDGGIATIDLSATFASIGGPEELLAVGQFALTATTFPGVRALRLRLDGTPIDIPLPDGALTEGAVTLRQFSALLESSGR